MSRREELFTPKQVARAIGVSESSVKRWCDSGLIETVRTAGGHRRLMGESVMTYVQKIGHQVVDPELHGLPSTTSDSLRMLQRSRDLFHQELLTGEEPLARQILRDAREAGHPLSAIFDEVLFAALTQLRQQTVKTKSNSTQLLRANEICLRLLFEIRTEIPETPPGSPLAFTAALDDSPTTLEVTASEIILRQAGWNASSLGTRLSFYTLMQAIELHQPALFCLQLTQILNEDEFPRQLTRLLSCAETNSTRLLLFAPQLQKQKQKLIQPHHPIQHYAQLEQIEK